MYNETATELLLKSFTVSAFNFLIVIFAPGLTYACCTDREQPISNCSFSYNHNQFLQDTVLCEIRGYAEHLIIDTCQDDGFTDVTNVPGTVKDMNVEYYYTTCSSAFQSDIPLVASSCHTHCNHGNATVHLGVNITFKAEEWSSEDLEAISISVRKGTDTTLRCIQFYFGRNKLSKDAAANHYFYFDGFVGLQPGIEYTVYVKALPTNEDWSNVHTKRIPAHYETCWKPDLLHHETPFALNITLFQDPTYNFKRFDISLGRQTKEIDFNTAKLYTIDGKWGTNVTFECQQPTMQERDLIIEPKECPFCVPNMTRIHITAAPPSFLDCPQDEILYEVKQGRFIEGDIVRGINWTVPTPIFQSKCNTDSNSTHIPIQSQFVVGRTTSVTYYVSQYGSVAKCTFNVHVKLEKSVSLPLIIGVSCAVGFLLILVIIMACFYSLIYTKRSTGKEISDAPESVPKKYTSDALCSISSNEEHGIPLYLLRDYPGSQSSLNSTKINRNPDISRHMKLQSSSEGYRSLPTKEHSSSGYMSETNRNSSQNSPHIGEENSTLLCRNERNRVDSRNEEGFSDDSRDPNDEAPISMQYMHIF